MVKAHAGIVESDDATAAEDKLHAAVADLVPDAAEAEWVETHMRPLVGLRVDDELEPSFAAWGRFFRALAERGPLVLAFEDLQWADDGLLDFIEHLADWLTGVPLVLLCAARPELYDRRARWGARPNAATITLAPLSEQDTATLITHLLRQQVLPAELQRALLMRAEGNPLYAEELVRMVEERGDLRDVPQSVHGIIAARLDALMPAEKTLLQDAAVVGRTFSAGALAAVRNESPAVVEGRLRELGRKEFAESTGDGDYCFHHSLIRDVAYAQIPRAARADKHLAVAAWLELLGRPDDNAETIAHHYLCALEFDRASGGDGNGFAASARVAFKEAGQRAQALHAHHAAARFFSAALELTGPDDPQRLELLYRAASSARAAGGAEPHERAAARDELLQAGELERGAELESMLGLLALDRGDQAGSLAHRRRAVELLRDSAPSRAKAYVLGNLASQLLLAGERGEAIASARTALEIAERLGLGDLRARSLRTIGSARVASGDVRGVDDLECCVEIARELNSAECVTGLVNLAATQLYLGNLARGHELQAEARRAAERFDDGVAARWLEIQRAGELYWAGRYDDALEILDGFIAEVEAGRPHYLEALARVTRGRIRLAREQVAEALDDAEKGFESASRTRDIQVLYPALAFRARTLLAAGQRSRAVPTVDELLARIELADALLGFLAWPDLASVLFELGRGSELVDWAANAPGSRWLDAATAHARGELLRAAEIYAEIGAGPEQALVLRRATAATSAS